MAGIVIGDAMREAGPDVADARNFHQVLGKFIHAPAKLHGFVMERVAYKQFGVKVADHRGARTGGTNNRISLVEHTNDAFRKRPGILPIACVKRRLSTASLLARKIQVAANPAQNLRHVHADLGAQLVHKAGDEQSHSWHRSSIKLDSLLRSGAPIKLKRRPVEWTAVY